MCVTQLIFLINFHKNIQDLNPLIFTVVTIELSINK